MKRGPKGRKIIKGLIFALCTVGILWIWYFLLTDHFKYNCEEISPWMDECVEYVKLEKDVVLTQEFIINQDGSFFLEAIETIFVNLPDDKKKGKLGISILNSNGSVIYEDVYEISDFVVGVYQKLEFSDIIPIQKKETYTLCFRAYDTDAIPYMLLQRDTVQNSLNRIAKVNDEIRSDSVLIKYHIGEKLSNVVKNIIISITIIFLSGCYHILWGLSPKVERRIMMLCCMIAMMPIVICGLYNRPYSDDLIFAKDAHKLVQEGKGIGSIIYSACETVVDYYYNWQGLYTSSFLHAVNPSIINEKAYMITTYILLLIFIITTYITIKNISVCFNVNMEKSRLFIAILLVTAFCQGLPSIREGLFWYTGAMSYIIHSYLILVNISFYCLYIKEQGKKTYLWIICSIILSVIITGGNHVTAFLNIMLLGLGNIYGIYKKKYGMISTFIIACVCFGIVFFAPGTSVRQGVLEKQSIMGTMFASLIEFPKLLKEWINLGWIAFLLLLSPCIIKNIKKQSNQKYMGMRIIGSILISSVLLLGMLCVPYYAMGHFGAGRLMNVIWFAFMILSLVVYTQVLMYLASKEIFVKIEKAFNRLSIIAILIVCTYGNHENTNHSTFWVTMNEVFVSQDAVTYAFERDERTSLINEAKEQEKKEITVPPIGTISWILCDGTDRADEMYYGIKVNVE